MELKHYLWHLDAIHILQNQSITIKPEFRGWKLDVSEFRGFGEILVILLDLPGTGTRPNFETFKLLNFKLLNF